MTSVLILDFGSQYTQLIARRIRELHVYCEVHPYSMSIEAIKVAAPTAIILSGGPASVFGEGAPHCDATIFELNIPILGICYGMQLICELLGGKVERADDREFGPAVLIVKSDADLFKNGGGTEWRVWMSHGDSVIAIPPGFQAIATTSSTPFAAIANSARRIFGVQFHPEVVHTPKGTTVLSNFLFECAHVKADWRPELWIEQAVGRIQAQVGDHAAVCGLSGGVDSTVAAVLVHKAIGQNLTCVFVDNGVLRKNEMQEVQTIFKEHAPELKVVYVDASKRFLDALHGVTDPEQKRKIIGKVFIDVFDEEAKRLQGVKFLVQGTLYPDVIESVSVKGPSVVIKTHHNVGGLPEKMHLGLVEPLRELFKDEVRALGARLGLPKTLLGRHPFPGPGLAIRCLDEVTAEKLRILRDADSLLQEEIVKADVYNALWQAFCVILPVRTVGVMGDERTYEHVIAVRCVESQDAMTADWARLPHDLLARISSRICNEVRGCNRVVYDISSKPPSTIEWE